jgi:hypothetical protein
LLDTALGLGERALSLGLLLLQLLPGVPLLLVAGRERRDLLVLLGLLLL